MTAPLIENRHLFAGANGAAALAQTIEACRRFAAAMPAGENEQATALQSIIAATGASVTSGALTLAPGLDSTDRVIRLFKERIGAGRLKLQLFPLADGEAHPPHAHYNLLSCQIVLRGRARVREYTLLDRLAGGELRVREEPVKDLRPGDGVFTLQRLHNIHWQQGLAAETVLLNINWQGFLGDNPMAGAHIEHGRCHIDWDNARPGQDDGTYIVPEIPEPARS